MAKPGTSTKIAIKGTRASDEITVTSTGVLVNDSERTYNETQIDVASSSMAATATIRSLAAPGPTNCWAAQAATR